MSGCNCGNGGCRGTGCGCDSATTMRSGSGLPQRKAFARPTFFAGQLLTEDDLEDLAGYITAKDRLHNRFLVGSGVVCGLEVRCHPRDPSKVVVTSGYALDCCGADVFVPCDVDVDLLSLISALPRDHACLDPCPPIEAKSSPPDDLSTASSANAGQDANGSLARHGQSATTKSTAASAARRYMLAVEYHEDRAQPAMTYAVTGGTEPNCEPTRIMEGYRFVIRCELQSCPPVTMISRLETCLGISCAKDGTETEPTLRQRVSDALDMARNIPSLVLSGDPDAPAKALFTTQALGTQKRRNALNDPVALRQEVAQTTAALFHADTFNAAREHLPAVLEATQELLRKEAVEGLEASRYRAMATTLQNCLDTIGAASGPTELDDTARLLALGVPAGRTMQDEYAAKLRELHKWLILRYEQLASRNCALPCELGSVRIDATQPETLISAAKVILHALGQLLVDCLCSAMNPPCPTCCDVAIPLAQVTVEGCNVVEICAGIREHVLTGPNLRYWSPTLANLDSMLKAFCCVDVSDWTVKQHYSAGLPDGHPLYDLVTAIESLKTGSKDTLHTAFGHLVKGVARG